MDNGDQPEYLIAAIRETLAKDPRVAEIELDVELEDGAARVRGTVQSVDRRRAVDEVLAERFPDLEVHNEIEVLSPPAAPREEDIR